MEALLTDLYQLTMMQGLFEKNMHEQRCVFDRFYRRNPYGGAYAVAAGLNHVIEYLENLRFTKEDLEYLKSTGIFKDAFLKYLEDFRFRGDVYAVPEGTVIFPQEVILRIEATKAEGMFIETAISMFMNHESLIATKARRIRIEAGDDYISEFGLRRAQGTSAAVYGTRATMIGGFDSTSNVLSAKKFNIRPAGTMAHSWIMSFPTELDAFRAYAEMYENMLVLLVDTYNTLESGVKNAITVFKEVRDRRGGTMPKGYGIRLDSGDLAYLSVEARAMLDKEGFTDAVIFASNDLDEYLIADLKRQKAAINAWGVGTKVITGAGSSSLGGVYKLAGQWEDDGTFTPKMKFSNNVEKVTNPGRKKVLRFYTKDDHKIIGDLIMLMDEHIDDTKDFVLYDPFFTWKKKHLKAGTYTVKEMLEPIFKEGKLVYQKPNLAEICAYAKEQIETLWPQFYRLVSPPENRVYISQSIFDLRKELAEKEGR